MNYGKRLKELRKERKLTQEQLAEQLGVSPTTLYNWENGVSRPTEKNRKALNELLHLDESEEKESERASAQRERDGEPSSEFSVTSCEGMYYSVPVCTGLPSLQSEDSRRQAAKKRRVRLVLQILGLLALLCVELVLTVFVAMNFCDMILPLEGDGANTNIKFPFSWLTCWIGFFLWIAVFVGMDLIVRKMIKNIKSMIKDRKRRKQGDLLR